jgi:Transcriptional regulator
MHIPSDYEINDKDVITAFMQQYPFAQLVCASDTFPIINHIPLLYDAEKHCLWGHLAKNNPDLKHLNNSSVTVVFSGVHGYISPDWYEKSGVPTWNYQPFMFRGFARQIIPVPKGKEDCGINCQSFIKHP